MDKGGDDIPMAVKRKPLPVSRQASCPQLAQRARADFVRTTSELALFDGGRSPVRGREDVARQVGADTPPMGSTARRAPAPDDLMRMDKTKPQVQTEVVESPVELPSPAPDANAGTSSPSTKDRSFFQAALNEATYFASGLISHPHESTSHVSILRHSSALVWYRGPTTSLALTVFADAPLPADRTFWLQRKGFSGNTGMNIAARLGSASTTTWIDLTPVSRAGPADVPAADERTWQRDMARFAKKAAKDRRLRKQSARETDVLRIPAAAADGYFRVVLCTGGGGGGGGSRNGSGSETGQDGHRRRKVLCPSPVFRIASTSADASVMRGASLASLPVEAGVKVASFVGRNFVARYTAPVTALASGPLQRLQPGRRVTEAGQAVYRGTGLDKRVAELGEVADQRRAAAYDVFGTEEAFDAPPEVVGPDSGPVEPYPVIFTGRVVAGTGRWYGQQTSGITNIEPGPHNPARSDQVDRLANQADTSPTSLYVPTANLADVPDKIKHRLNGVYFGWARIIPAKGQDALSQDWHEAIISAGPSPYARPQVVPEKLVTAHLLHDFGGEAFVGARLELMAMGFLRPGKAAGTAEAEMAEAVAGDVAVAAASLSRERWGPETTARRVETLRKARSFGDRFVEAREEAQRTVDRIPAHWAGVRTMGAELRDRAYGNGGLWIPRG